MTKTTKQTRRDLHEAINALSRAEVAEIVKKEFPRAGRKRVDELAKEMVGEAHRLVSPRERHTES
jgi:histone H3/H4